MALQLIEIKDFPKTTTLSGTGEELIVVSKADGKTYGIKTSDFKAFLGTVQTVTPRPIKPSDPEPTTDGIYIPTESGLYPGGITIDLSDGYNQLLRSGGEWSKVVSLIDLSASVDSPFRTIPQSGSNGNAILNVEVYTKYTGDYRFYGLTYIWKNSTEFDGWHLRLVGQVSGGSSWDNIADWAMPLNGYTPEKDIERIKLNAGCYVTLDWSRMADNSFDNGIYLLKKECIKVEPQLDGSGSQFTNDPGSLPSFLTNAVKSINALTSNFEAFTQNEYALCYIWKNVELTSGNFVNLVRIGRMVNKTGFTDNYAALLWSEPDISGVKTYTLNDVKITIDWAQVEDGTSWNGAAWFKNIMFSATGGQLSESFGNRDTIEAQIIVKKDGTGDYTTIKDAYDSIKDSSYTKQYEICVYPGLYEEYNLIPPPYTHTHGLAANTVTVSSKLWKLINTLPVFDQQHGSSKLSNMTIESWTGYCIHFDVALNKSTLLNENLRLRKIDYAGVISDAIIGGGSFSLGTKFVWKSNIFEDGQALCHTNGNALNENLHLIFEDCSFKDAWAGIGSVGGFGHCVVELNGCRFTRGKNSLISWNSPIRNIEDPTLYLFNTVEWQIIGGNNENFAPSISSTGKTIQFTANTDIEVSGSAANIIFGGVPTRRKKGARFDAALTSMYNIQDVQAGMDGYSARVDVFQLWKRLGDCSSVNKTLTVTAQSTTKTFTFTKNYLSTKDSQASIISAMQAVLTNVTISAINSQKYTYENINTTDKIYIKLAAADVLRREFLTRSGTIAVDSTALNDIAGIAVDDGVLGEGVPVWIGCFWPDNTLVDGAYGLDGSGVLSVDASLKIGDVEGGIFYPRY